MKLYHYGSLKALEQLEYLRKFVEQKIWFSQISKLNDPFEGDFVLEQASPGDRLSDPVLLEQAVQMVKKTIPESTREEVVASLKEESNQPFNNQINANDKFNSHGLFCLTQSDSNIPMWAHYGDDHCGYCVEFEIDFTKHPQVVPRCLSIEEYEKNVLGDGARTLGFFCEDVYFHFGKVDYRIDRPMPKVTELEIHRLKKLDPSGFMLEEYKFKNSVGVKFYQWEYEQEFRLVSKFNGLLDLKKYPPFLRVTGVILGDKFGQKIEDDLKNYLIGQSLLDTTSPDNASLLEIFVRKNLNQWMCPGYPIDLYKAKSSKTEYKIEKEITQFLK